MQIDPTARALLESVTESVMLIGTDATILAANQVAASRLGLVSPSEAVGLDLLSLVPPRLANLRREKIEETIWRGRHVNFEDLHQGRVQMHSLYPILNSQNEVESLVFFSHDITEYRRTLEELNAERQRHIFLMEALPGFVFLVDSEHHIRYANSSFRRQFGSPAGRTCHQVLMGKESPCDTCNTFAPLDTARQESWEWRDATGRVHQLYCHPMTDIDRSPVVIVLGLDVTDRVVAEEALRQAKNYQQAILDNIPDMAWLKDLDGRFVAVNRAFAATRGKDADELVGQRDELPWDDSLGGLYDSRDAEVIQSRRRMTTEEELADASGERFWLETSRVPVTEEDGQPIGIVGISRDITERKRAVDRLRYSHAELEKRVRERTRELEDARKNAEAATQAKTTFLASMSHEIRTPLNVILGMADMAMSQNDLGTVRQYMKMVSEAGSSLLSVINDILDYTRIESRKLTLERIDFDLAGLLEGTHDIHELQASQKGLPIHLKIDPGMPRYVRGDPARLKQILNNLLANAVKFTSRGEIRLAAKAGDADAEGRLPVTFRVTDTGKGIPANKLRIIFQSFRQADDSINREFGGSGLGLSICKRLVELMGGEIGVESRPGKGSEFWFRVSFEPGRAEDALAIDKPEDTAPAPDSSLRVLVVDDHALNREMVLIALRNKGAEVLCAASGPEALEILVREPVDLVLMDIQMPGMDGMETTGRIRQAKNLAVPPSIPVVAMTAFALKGDKEKFLAAGMDDYIAKPVDMKLLLSTVSRLTGKTTLPATKKMTDLQKKPRGTRIGRNRAKALELLGGNEKLLARLETVFLRDTPGDLEMLNSAIEKKDMQKTALTAHMIKGTSATVGAEDVSNTAKELEFAARQNRARDIAPLLAELRKQIAGFLGELNAGGVEK